MIRLSWNAKKAKELIEDGAPTQEVVEFIENEVLNLDGIPEYDGKDAAKEFAKEYGNLTSLEKLLEELALESVDEIYRRKVEEKATEIKSKLNEESGEKISPISLKYVEALKELDLNSINEEAIEEAEKKKHEYLEKLIPVLDEVQEKLFSIEKLAGIERIEIVLPPEIKLSDDAHLMLDYLIKNEGIAYLSHLKKCWSELGGSRGEIRSACEELERQEFLTARDVDAGQLNLPEPDSTVAYEITPEGVRYVLNREGIDHVKLERDLKMCGLDRNDRISETEIAHMTSYLRDNVDVLIDKFPLLIRTALNEINLTEIGKIYQKVLQEENYS